MTLRGLMRWRMAAIDAGGGRLAWAKFGRTGRGRLTMEAFSLATGRSEPDAESRWADEWGEQLAALAGKRRRGEVHLAVPGHLALTKFVRTPAVGRSKVRDVARFEASQTIPHSLDEVVWDYAVLANDGREIELMLTAAKRDAVEGLCAAVEGGGFRVVRALPSCFALWHCYRLNYPEAKEGVLIVDVGARSTDLVFVEPARFFVRTLAFAGSALGPAMSNMGGPFSEEPAVRLQREISRSLLNARRQGAMLEPKRILLLAEGVEFEGLAGRLSATAGLPVERLDALRRVELSAEAVASGAKEAAGQLAGAVGLAAAELAGERRPDLAPETYRTAAIARRRRPVWLATAALLVAALMPPIWHYERAGRAVERRMAEVEAGLAPLRTIANRNAANLRRLEEQRTRLERVRSVVEARTAWPRLLAELQDNLAGSGDVWLDRLAIEPADDEGPLRVAVSGRMLDRERPREKAGPGVYGRVKRLLESFENAEGVAAVEDARFDNSRSGILGFDLTLVLAEGAGL